MEPNRTAACISLASFVLFSSGCISWRTRGLGGESRPPKPSVRILSVTMKVEGVILFAKSSPGRIERGAVAGVAVGGGWERVEIRKPFRLAKKRSDGRIYEVTGGDGRIYPVLEVLSEDADRLVILLGIAEPTPVSIPLAEIASIRLRKFSFIKTALLTAAVLGTAAVIYRQAMWAWE